MEIDTKKTYEMFMEWSKQNEGTWVNRSINVAEVAKRIAKEIGLDEAKAYAMGLLYDIGRIKGNTGVRHTIDGYNFLKEARLWRACKNMYNSRIYNKRCNKYNRRI